MAFHRMFLVKLFFTIIFHYRVSDNIDLYHSGYQPTYHLIKPLCHLFCQNRKYKCCTGAYYNWDWHYSIDQTERLIMEQNQKKTAAYYLRALHRDLGFLAIGLIIVYSLSGIVLIYRDKGFMNTEVQVEKTLQPNLEPRQLGNELRIREMRDTKTEGDIIYFKDGYYNKVTGLASYKTKEVIFPFNKFIALHKSNSMESTHLFQTIFGIILLFLSISSFWMFKKGTKSFSRGLILSGTGIVVTIIILLI